MSYQRHFFPHQLMAAHAQDEEALAERLEMEKSRRQAALRDRLAEQRRRRMEDLRRRQDAEIMNEMLDQRKEVDEIRVAQVGFSLQRLWKISVCMLQYFPWFFKQYSGNPLPKN